MNLANHMNFFYPFINVSAKIQVSSLRYSLSKHCRYKASCTLIIYL